MGQQIPNSNGKRYSSPMMGCLAVLLIFVAHSLLLYHLIGRMKYTVMSILTLFLAAMLLFGLAKLLLLTNTARRMVHSASRRYYLMSVGFADVGVLFLLLGILLRYAETAYPVAFGGPVIAGSLELAGLSGVWFAATLSAPSNLVGIGENEPDC